MEAYPIELSYHVRDYYFGERLIPEMLGKQYAPEGVVAETWEISDYRETTETVANGSYKGRTLHQLIREFLDELVQRASFVWTVGDRPRGFPVVAELPGLGDHAVGRVLLA